MSLADDILKYKLRQNLIKQQKAKLLQIKLALIKR